MEAGNQFSKTQFPRNANISKHTYQFHVIMKKKYNINYRLESVISMSCYNDSYQTEKIIIDQIRFFVMTVKFAVVD